ncbi:hypothetical protein [uncultured Eubacterium sp.]|uniref:hypothetical protein n=1 Tax=uncultured Eubacterium sp. TaxID=165185 RepID=UPI00262A79EE|nr:hypothetical protein [uncultured Eubacterium sp.]
MKTKKKKLLIVFLVLIIGVPACLSVPAVRTLQAKYYLSQKYDAKMSEFSVKDYKGKHLMPSEDMIFFEEYYLVGYSFEFEYNGRNFIVSKTDNGLYDDYQLENIQEWCTNWLKNNADLNMRGLSLDTDDILNYCENNNKDYSYVITEADAKNFLVNYVTNGSNDVFYCDKSADDSIGEYAASALGVKYKISPIFTDEKIEKKIYKYSTSSWMSYIGIE